MIKIEPYNISEIEKKHLTFCKQFCLKAIRFYKDFLTRLASKSLVIIDSKESVSKHYELHSETLKVMIQPYLKKEYKKQRKDKISIEDLKTLLTTSDHHIIKYPKKLNSFRKTIRLIEEIERRIDDILIGKPYLLNSIKLDPIFKDFNQTDKYIIRNIFDYETFRDNGIGLANENWGSYTLTSSLGVSVCPYCNRNWINTVGSQNLKITNPQLDHYFSQSDYPMLRLSLYNLIPSCETCNSRIKKKKELKYSENLHPFEDGYGDNVTFFAIAENVESANGRANDFTINVKENKFGNHKIIEKALKNHEFFKINSIYKRHGDIVSDLYLKKTKYGTNLLKSLRSTINFPKDISEADLYRIAFANYYFEKDFNKRPFSKLTKDIVKQLELIK